MITSDMLTPIATAVAENIKVILPVGITIMGGIIGVGMIPRIVYKFI